MITKIRYHWSKEIPQKTLSKILENIAHVGYMFEVCRYCINSHFISWTTSYLCTLLNETCEIYSHFSYKLVNFQLLKFLNPPRRIPILPILRGFCKYLAQKFPDRELIHLFHLSIIFQNLVNAFQRYMNKFCGLNCSRDIKVSIFALKIWKIT